MSRKRIFEAMNEVSIQMIRRSGKFKSAPQIKNQLTISADYNLQVF
jgi:hypothetical protein